MLSSSSVDWSELEEPENSQNISVGDEAGSTDSDAAPPPVHSKKRAGGQGEVQSSSGLIADISESSVPKKARTTKGSKPQLTLGVAKKPALEKSTMDSATLPGIAQECDSPIVDYITD